MLYPLVLLQYSLQVPQLTIDRSGELKPCFVIPGHITHPLGEKLFPANPVEHLSCALFVNADLLYLE